MLGAFIAATLILLAPAIWNDFPFMFFDTGAYFERPFEGTISAGRSMVYGLWLAALRYPHFWPVAAAQCAISVWVIYLMLRTHGLGNRPAALPLTLVAVTLTLATLTALPWFAGQMMPDLFAALAVLALYLLVFKRGQLGRFEPYALAALIIFASTAHNATLAVLLLLLAAGWVIAPFAKKILPFRALRFATVATLLSILILPTVNFVFGGKFAWTPGGSAFIFSRLVQDGIVARYLADKCPDPAIRLCKFEKQIPKTADDFLWHQAPHGPFVSIGGFDGAEHMNPITLESLTMYPWMHVTTAVKSTLIQLVKVETGDGIVQEIWSAYAGIDKYAPESSVAMHTSRQRFKLLPPVFTALNKVHVPLALGSMAFLPLLLVFAWRRGTIRDTDLLAATIILALFANAFVTGVLSNPHHRYGARVAWMAPFLWSLLAVQFLLLRSGWQETAIRALASIGLSQKPVPLPVPASQPEKSR
ncbi:MAG: hypothetical protein KIS70_09000 [Xanthobacteraceae bacterium]|nr:hypothetical protein [Xanthobacteraceae bacterium]